MRLHLTTKVRFRKAEVGKFYIQASKNKYMFPFERNLPANKVGAIEKISQLIEQLKEKKEDWKRFHPYYGITDFSQQKLIAGVEHYDEPSREEMRFRKRLIRVMESLKKACIILCSDYLSLFKKAQKYIRKCEGKHLVLLLSEICNIMASIYEELLKAEWIKELRKVHRLELKMKLLGRRTTRTWLKEMSTWNSQQFKEFYKGKGIEPLINEDYVPTLRKIAEKRLNSLSDYKNWKRLEAPFSRDFRKAYEFQKYILQLIEVFKRITKEMQTWC